jgi:hypothetical protein
MVAPSFGTCPRIRWRIGVQGTPEDPPIPWGPNVLLSRRDTRIRRIDSERCREGREMILLLYKDAPEAL